MKTQASKGQGTQMLASLFLTFAKIGLFTFGGGYAMLSLIENICVEEKQWITHDEMMNVTVIAESTPGPIAINCATYVGYKQAGFWGSVLATVGMIIPSFVIIYAISMFLNRFLEITWVASAFKGIKIAVGLLIFDAGLTMLRKMQKKALPMVIVAGSFAVMLAINLFSLRFSTIALMLACAAVSLCIFVMQGAPEKGGAGK